MCEMPLWGNHLLQPAIFLLTGTNALKKTGKKEGREKEKGKERKERGEREEKDRIHHTNTLL
jgi:hypothetical protein